MLVFFLEVGETYLDLISCIFFPLGTWYVYMKISVQVFEMSNCENNLIMKLKFYLNLEKENMKIMMFSSRIPMKFLMDRADLIVWTVHLDLYYMLHLGWEIWTSCRIAAIILSILNMIPRQNTARRNMIHIQWVLDEPLAESERISLNWEARRALLAPGLDIGRLKGWKWKQSL